MRLIGSAATGAGWCVVRLVTYCLAYPEYAPMIREARDADRPRRAHVMTRAWRRAALHRCGFFLALTLVCWWGWTVAADRWGVLAKVVITTAGVVVLAVIGGIVRPRAARPDNPTAEPEVPENAPYPIADAHTRAEAADCVARALAAENIALRMSGEAQRTRWGWTVPVILRTGTPAAIVAKTGELETHWDLPAGGVLATPDRSRRARVVLRLAVSDPFATLGYAPPRPPASGSIDQRAVIGGQIDGQPLAVPLAGVHGVVIGSPGSGKSSTLLSIADAVSACADAVVWDLDPAGDGLAALGAGVGRSERDQAGIEDALADALACAEVRPRMLTGKGMGAVWHPDSEHPAIVVVVDEYPRLSARGKQLAVQLLRVGRKARVTLILAATEATSDALGAAIADTTALKIMHACRFPDVQLVLGPQMGAEGWRPDRLHPATADDPGDAGRCYVATAGHREPLLCKIAPIEVAQAAEHGAARAAVGLPRIDADTWQLARARRAQQTADQPGAGRAVTGLGADRAPVRQEVDRQGITEVIGVFDTDPRLWTEDLLARLATLGTRYEGWSGEDLAALVRPLGVGPRSVRIGESVRRGYYRDDLAAAFEAWKAGGDQG
jgi:DNA segregation ATPase FtsK/SpoIIIE, S-DNA-T family